MRLDTLMFAPINELDVCPYEMDMFAALLEQAQKVVDEFCLHDFSNFPKWIELVDGQIERKLFDRLQAAITLWKKALIRQEKGKTKEKKRMRLKVSDAHWSMRNRNALLLENRPRDSHRQPNVSPGPAVRIRA